VYRAVLLIALFGGVTGHARRKRHSPHPLHRGRTGNRNRSTTDLSGPGAAPGRTLKPAESTPVSGQPFRVGSFVVLPEIDVTYLYDDNGVLHECDDGQRPRQHRVSGNLGAVKLGAACT